MGNRSVEGASARKTFDMEADQSPRLRIDRAAARSASRLGRAHSRGCIGRERRRVPGRHRAELTSGDVELDLRPSNESREPRALARVLVVVRQTCERRFGRRARLFHGVVVDVGRHRT